MEKEKQEKVLTLDGLYQSVAYEENVQYVDYWRDLDQSLIDSYIDSHEIYTKCSSECITCQITHIEKYKEKCPDTPRDSYKRMRSSKKDVDPSHAWQIQCPFIPEDFNSIIPAHLKMHMDEKDLESARLINDPVEFGAKYFSWHARKHQELMLRCQSKKKVLRWGRRAGKSEAFVIEALFHGLTKRVIEVDPVTGEEIESGLKILVVAPFESQVINIFEMLTKFLDRSPHFKNSVKKYRKSPHHHLEFKNGCVIKGFTTGANDAASIRGQDAHIIILDECDYMSEGDYKTVMPIAQSHPNVMVRASSTPQGKRERFWEWSTQNPQWKEFYFPSAVIDKTDKSKTDIRWKEMRREMRPEYSHDSWLQEIMAIFIASASGVYQPGFVSSAMKDYSYEALREAKAADVPEMAGWRFTFGVDWNSNAGTEISVVGFNPHGGGFQVVDMVNVPKQDFTQYKGLSKITEMLKFWKPDYVYVDAGHGATNWEMLRLWAGKQPPGSYERGLERKIKRYEFGGKVEIRDPVTKKLVKHPAKAYMVENSVRKFEDGVITFSKNDEVLRKQLMNYIIQSVSESGKPIYGMENKRIGDHRLDALNLALVAWALEEGNMARFSKNVITKIGLLGTKAHQIVNEATSADKAASAYNTVATLKNSLEERQETISKRNDMISSSDQRPEWLQPTAEHRPGFLSDTEHMYSKPGSMVRHRKVKRNKWSSRSKI